MKLAISILLSLGVSLFIIVPVMFVFQDADSRRVFLALWVVVFLFVQPKIGKL